MKVLGNILWIIFGGFWWAVAMFLAGIAYCCTIIFIPVGIQLFKLAKFVFWPFGKSVEKVNANGFKGFLNVLWAIFGGLWMAIGFFFTGLIFCITIIGIPFGKQYFKIAKFIIAPLGKNFVVVEKNQEAE